MEELTSGLEETSNQVIGKLDNISYGCKTIMLIWDPDYDYEDYLDCNPGEPRQKEYFFYTDADEEEIGDKYNLIKQCFREMFESSFDLEQIAREVLRDIDGR